jgi:hypothetical protein
VRPVVTNVDVQPCFTFTGIVVPEYPVTGICIMIGRLKWSPLPEIPNSRALCGVSFDKSHPVTVIDRALIELASNVDPPEALVITVPLGITLDAPLDDTNVTGDCTVTCVVVENDPPENVVAHENVDPDTGIADTKRFPELVSVITTDPVPTFPLASVAVTTRVLRVS